MKRFSIYIALILTVFVAVACGGSGGGGGTSNTFAGAYKTDFARGVANSTMLVTIANNGGTTFVISDSTGVLFSGTGTTTPTGHVTGTAAGVAPTIGTVTIVGDLTSGTPPTMSLTLTGALTDNVGLIQIATGGISALAGHLNGSYFGDETGTFTMDIATDGKVTGNVIEGPATVPINGSVSVSGTVNFTGAGTVGTTTWKGSFFFVPGSSLVQGIGTWKNGSETGTWSASQGT